MQAHTLFSTLAARIIRHPVATLAVCALALGGAVSVGLRVELHTSRDELGPADDPDQQRLAEIRAEYPGAASLIVRVAATSPGAADRPALRAFADDLAAALRNTPSVAGVFHRVDPGWLAENGLWIAPTGVLDELSALLAAPDALLAGLSGADGLAEWNRRLAGRITTGMTVETAARDGASAVEQGRRLAALLAAQRDFLDRPLAVAARRAARRGLAALGGEAGLPADGYLTSRDGSAIYLLVAPAGSDDSVPARRAFLKAVRAQVERLQAAEPGIAVTFAGQPALTVDEATAITRDTWRAALLAMAGVALLTLAMFRWKMHAVLILIALGTGVAWAYGAVWLELGHLNLISAAFLSTLVGIGVDYGVHPVSEYEMEGAHTVDGSEAIRRAYHRTGPAVTVGALTTAVAFFSLRLMRFDGFAELGLVAGGGVIFCLLATLIVLPALLSLHGRRRRARGTGGGVPRALIDRLWVDRAAIHICRVPRAVIAASVALTMLLAWVGRDVTINTDLRAMLPASSPTLATERLMAAESDLSPLVCLALSPDLATLRDLVRRAAAEPTIARVDSILPFLPDDIDATRPRLARLARAAAALTWPRHLTPVDRDDLAGALATLEAAVTRAGEAAFSAGLGPMAQALEAARAAVAASRRRVATAPSTAPADWTAGQQQLLDSIRSAVADIDRSARLPPPTSADLPDPLRDRFVTTRGRFIAFLHPAGDLFDPGFRAAYVAAVKRVTPQATGFPVMFDKIATQITAGFGRAAGVGALLVVGVLFADFRRVGLTLLALVPLAMGLVWMQGIMQITGLSYNFANLVAIPLILGVGIDNGVHLIHCYRLTRSPRMTRVIAHTGRAILIASLTTMVGFGSLATASHRGLASLGLVLLIGVGCCLITSIVVLPNLLVVLRRARR
ncbi:MAG: RND family transporter [Acidobacteriota bacterium]